MIFSHWFIQLEFPEFPMHFVLKFFNSFHTEEPKRFSDKGLNFPSPMHWYGAIVMMEFVNGAI